MNNEESLISVQLTDLDKLYVVTKQFAGKKYFLRRKRGGGYKCDQKIAEGCKIFDNIEEAQNAAACINEHKQKVKLKVETASTYFCNKVTYSFNRYNWRSSSLLNIKNTMVPIERFSEQLKGAKKKALEQKERFVSHCKEQLDLEERSVAQIEREYLETVKRAKDRKEHRLAERAKKITSYKNDLDKVDRLNYDDFVQQVETEQDKKYKILFGEIEL